MRTAAILITELLSYWQWCPGQDLNLEPID
jgi:hypothetical protein